MTVIPVVNCPDFACASTRAYVASAFSPWIHIDVADGRFTPARSWGNPEELSLLLGRFPSLHAEVHLMVEDPESVLPAWFGAGAERVIVHWEALTDRDVHRKFPDRTIVTSTKPETPIEDMLPYLTPSSWVQILAVPVGYSGMPFDLSVLEKVRVLRERFPELVIEIDGGITLETVRLVKGVADIVTSASFIFGNPDPAAAFRELQEA
jgi:ribulose-phosphate 3-epimerase